MAKIEILAGNTLYRAEMNSYAGELFQAPNLDAAIEYANEHYFGSHCDHNGFSDRTISVWTGSRFTPAWLVGHNTTMARLGYTGGGIDPCLTELEAGA